ncbi:MULTISPECIES: hypothetical protein [Kordiimonas]|jgi:hypothetical protein|uniref:Uncharacterized protein n=1 Tax=Kordiimonas lacus TaxID=637679 RepID=A0A1G6WFB0_9PROT|nr:MULTISPECIES: hypothetical protein [Kordiimonas]SDD64413.1 hypothetical protein SAMN04488071_1084 [Kordiimonas lacus]
MRGRKWRRLVNRHALKGKFQSVRSKLDYRDPTLGAANKGRPLLGVENIVVALILLILIGALGYALGVNMNGLWQ